MIKHKKTSSVHWRSELQPKWVVYDATNQDFTLGFVEQINQFSFKALNQDLTIVTYHKSFNNAVKHLTRCYQLRCSYKEYINKRPPLDET